MVKKSSKVQTAKYTSKANPKKSRSRCRRNLTIPRTATYNQGLVMWDTKTQNDDVPLSEWVNSVSGVVWLCADWMWVTESWVVVALSSHVCRKWGIVGTGVQDGFQWLRFQWRWTSAAAEPDSKHEERVNIDVTDVTLRVWMWVVFCLENGNISNCFIFTCTLFLVLQVDTPVT